MCREWTRLGLPRRILNAEVDGGGKGRTEDFQAQLGMKFYRKDETGMRK